MRTLVPVSVVATALVSLTPVAHGQGQGMPPNAPPASSLPMVTPGPSRPVYIINTGEGEQPVSISFVTPEGTVGANAAAVLFSDLNFTVPDGQRLIIEYVDVEFYSVPRTNDGTLTAVLFITDTGDPANSHFHRFGVGRDAIGCTLLQSCLFVSESLRLFAESGSRLSLDVRPILTEESTFTFARGTINGTLVPIPAE